MKKILLSILLLNVLGEMAFAAPIENPQWAVCSQNQECAIYDASCEGFVAYNKKYLKPLRNYYRSINATKTCAEPTPPLQNFEAVCNGNQCTLNEVVKPAA